MHADVLPAPFPLMLLTVSPHPYCQVEALASTSTRPLAGFTPRKGAGLPLFGKSFTGPPARPNMRVDFQFDQAAFYIKRLPFTLPYPVPFRYLGDETKGARQNN